MKKIITIIGARPQFIKASIISNIIKDIDNIEEIIVHTGQHFDKNMSKIFFDELQIPEATYNLNINKMSHSRMTSMMLEDLGDILEDENPNMVLLYGDTNSTLSGALAASKLNIPISHIEAGLRSYDKKMPEEINRIITDHISSLLFCPTEQSIKNLLKEGFTSETGIRFVGDVMYDLFLKYKNVCKDRKILKDIPKNYILITIHREDNTTKEKINKILSIMENTCKEYDIKVVFPVHPRTFKLIDFTKKYEGIYFINPVSYMDMLCLEMNSKLIVTDSGGVQKEACWCKIDCITLRDSSEWVETIQMGWNELCNIDENEFFNYLNNIKILRNRENPNYGNGKSGEKIIEEILKY